MKTDKEYPATHSMATSWFAVDAEGNVGIIEFEDNGPVPAARVPEMECSDSIISEALSADSKNRISFEPAQILEMMKGSVSAEEYLQIHTKNSFVTESLIEIDPDKLPELQKAVAHSQKNRFVPILPDNGIYFIELWYNYLDNSALKTDEELSDQIYRSLFENNVIRRIVNIHFDFDFQDGDFEGQLKPSDIPFARILQDYSNGDIEVIRSPRPTDVKLEQLGSGLQKKVLRLPIKFSDTSKFRIEDYYPDAEAY